MKLNRWLALAALCSPAAKADDLADQIARLNWDHQFATGCKKEEAQIVFHVTLHMKDVLGRDQQWFYCRLHRPTSVNPDGTKKRWTRVYSGMTSMKKLDGSRDGKGFGVSSSGDIHSVKRDGFVYSLALSWGFHGPGQPVENMSTSFPCRWVASQTFETNGLCVTVNTRTVEMQLEPAHAAEPSQSSGR